MLLRQALTRLSALETRLGAIDLEMMDGVTMRAEMNHAYDELSHLRECIEGLDRDHPNRRDAMSDPTPAHPSKLQTFILHFFSWHALMLLAGQATMIVGLLATWTAQVPQLSQVHAFLVALGALITLAGGIKASLFKTPEEKAAVHAARARTLLAATTSSSSGTTVLPLLLCGFALALSACATTWGKAFVASEKACQVTAIPAEKQAAYVEVEAALADPLNWEAYLLALVVKEGAEQVNCLVMAARAAEIANNAPDAGAAKAQLNLVKVHNADAWLSKHGGGKR